MSASDSSLRNWDGCQY